MSDFAPTSPEPPRKRQAAEFRAWVRYPPRRLEMLLHLFGVRPAEPRQVRIQDISAQGVGLVTNQSFIQGSVLVLRFPGTSLETKTPLLVRVKHLQPLPEGQFKVGCTFVVPLTDEQLAELI
jgi:hypothetical protein